MLYVLLMGITTILGILGKRYQYIVGGNKLKICDFTNPELHFLNATCNFTKDEELLFNLRARDIPLEECAECLNISVSTVNRLNRKLKTKIARAKDEMYQSGLTDRFGANENRNLF